MEDQVAIYLHGELIEFVRRIFFRGSTAIAIAVAVFYKVMQG